MTKDEMDAMAEQLRQSNARARQAKEQAKRDKERAAFAVERARLEALGVEFPDLGGAR